VISSLPALAIYRKVRFTPEGRHQIGHGRRLFFAITGNAVDALAKSEVRHTPGE
jgi:hypothetical protein